MTRTDAVGQVIQVGDEVLYAYVGRGSVDFVPGRITNFTPELMDVALSRKTFLGKDTVRTSSSRVIKLSHEGLSL